MPDNFQSNVYYGLNKSQFLETTTSRIYNCSISDLISMGLFKFDKDKTVMFPKANLYVRDALGWANIYRIRVLSFLKLDFNPIIIKTRNNSVVASEEILIPVYSNNIIIGFHGEIKYSYKLKSINEIDRLFDKVMTFNYNDDKISTLESFEIERPKKEFFINNYWVVIETMTQFMNLNGVQVHI